MRKAGLILILILIFAVPCFGADTDTSRESYVRLRDYLDRLFVEQNRYIDMRFNSIDATFLEKQRALDVSSSVLDAKFVKIDEYIKTTGLISGEVAALRNRLTKMETKGESQETQSTMQKAEAAALVRWWAIGLGAFFSLVNILIILFFNHRKAEN